MADELKCYVDGSIRSLIITNLFVGDYCLTSLWTEVAQIVCRTLFDDCHGPQAHVILLARDLTAYQTILC